MNEITIQKTIYSLDEFNNVVDTEFSELASSATPTDGLATPDMTVADFFSQYDSLYYEIPVSGSDESHLGLASRSLAQVGVSLEDLQAEISYLRQENTDLKNQILQLSSLNPGDLEEV